MTRCNRLIFLLLLIFACFQANAQDFYDEPHSARFADYLFQSQQYDLAAQEYERLLYANPSAELYKIQLFRSYRKSGNLSLDQNRFEGIFKDSLHFISEPIAQEYLHLLMLQNKLGDAVRYNSANNNISGLQKNYNLFQISLLAKNWKRADSLSSLINNLDPQYKEMLVSARQIKHRSPVLAMTFSMVLPGSGKAYSGYWKDGIVSFLFVAASGWQTYRGFSKNGVSSASGWIWGSIGTGFYLGNIYGSFKSAQRFNTRQNERLHKRAENYIYSTF
jgi:hypothetical protein